MVAKASLAHVLLFCTNNISSSKGSNKKSKKKKKSVFSTTLNVCVKRCYSNKMQTLKAKAEFISTFLNHIMHSSFYVVIWEMNVCKSKPHG